MFDAEVWYYVWAVLLLLANAALWCSTFLALPGNWGIVLLTALFVLFVPHGEGQGIGWVTVGVATALAAVGEIVELIAGAAGAAKQGASRRAMLLALGGTMLGSVLGAVVGVPVPVVGPVIGALAGGAVGAFAGAFLGEAWKGRSTGESFTVGRGALVGRLLGTVGKLALGAIAVIAVTVDSFV